MKSNFLTLLISLALISSLHTQVTFTEMTQMAGLTQVGLNFGTAVADFNNDGLEDVFATRILQGCMLYQNMGNGTFQNLTAQSGIVSPNTAQFAVWGDIDNDGWADLLIASRDEPNVLYRSNKDGTFSNITLTAGVANGTKVKAALFADVNMDGWLDIYLARLGLENILYRNNGDGTFTDVTQSSGATDPLISMGAVFFDYDNDGDPDLYLTHDANIPNILYKNNGNGTFVNVSAFSGTDIATMGMGVDVGDVNNDGWLDIYVTNLGANTLLLNNGNGTFTNISQSAGVADPGMGWGCSFLDFDNDGWQDIYMANDSNFSPWPNLLYRNNGDNTFSIVSENSVLHSMQGGYGFSCFDYDMDGKLDIYLANYAGSVGNQLFKNEETNGNNWLKVKLKGKESNAMGIGSRVKLMAGDLLQIDEITAGSGWASQNSQILHFGVGENDLVDLLTVHWPSGLVDSFENVNVNQLVEITEGDSNIENPTTQDNLIQSEFGFAISPNPVQELLTILFHDKTHLLPNIQVRVMNCQGKILKTIELDAGSPVLNIDTSSFPKGILFCQIGAGGQVSTQKIVKF